VSGGLLPDFKRLDDAFITAVMPADAQPISPCLCRRVLDNASVDASDGAAIA